MVIRCHLLGKTGHIEELCKHVVHVTIFLCRTLHKDTGRTLGTTKRSAFLRLNCSERRVRRDVTLDIRVRNIKGTYFMSLSDLLPTITMGTLGRFFRLDRPADPEIALNFVSRICSRSRITSSNDSRESMLKTSTKMSPKTLFNKSKKFSNQDGLFCGCW